MYSFALLLGLYIQGETKTQSLATVGPKCAKNFTMNCSYTFKVSCDSLKVSCAVKSLTMMT